MNSIVFRLIFAIALCTGSAHAYKITTALNQELDKAISQENAASFSRILLSLSSDATLVYKGEELSLYRYMLKAYPDIEKKIQTQESIMNSINKFGVYTIAIYLVSAICLLIFKNDNFPAGLSADKLKKLRETREKQTRAFSFVLFTGSGIMLGTMGVISFFLQDSLTATEQLKLFMQEFLKKHPLPKELSQEIKLADYLALVMLKQEYLTS